MTGGADYELPPLSTDKTLAAVKQLLEEAGKGQISSLRLIYKVLAGVDVEHAMMHTVTDDGTTSNII